MVVKRRKIRAKTRRDVDAIIKAQSENPGLSSVAALGKKPRKKRMAKPVRQTPAEGDVHVGRPKLPEGQVRKMISLRLHPVMLQKMNVCRGGEPQGHYLETLVQRDWEARYPAKAERERKALAGESEE